MNIINFVHERAKFELRMLTDDSDNSLFKRYEVLPIIRNYSAIITYAKTLISQTLSIDRTTIQNE